MSNTIEKITKVLNNFNANKRIDTLVLQYIERNEGQRCNNRLCKNIENYIREVTRANYWFSLSKSRYGRLSLCWSSYGNDYHSNGLVLSNNTNMTTARICMNFIRKENAEFLASLEEDDIIKTAFTQQGMIEEMAEVIDAFKDVQSYAKERVAASPLGKHRFMVLQAFGLADLLR